MTVCRCGTRFRGIKNPDCRGQELLRGGLGEGLEIREAVMHRSPPSHRFLLRLALFFTSLPLVAIAFAPPAWAAIVPTPSAGPPFVPSSGHLGDPLGILLAGALVGAAVLAVTVLIIAVGSRRSTAAAALPASRGMTLERPVDRGEPGFTARPEAGRDQESTRRHAA
jgi:hypothetical protein